MRVADAAAQLYETVCRTHDKRPDASQRAFLQEILQRNNFAAPAVLELSEAVMAGRLWQERAPTPAEILRELHRRATTGPAVDAAWQDGATAHDLSADEAAGLYNPLAPQELATLSPKWRDVVEQCSNPNVDAATKLKRILDGLEGSPMTSPMPGTEPGSSTSSRSDDGGDA